MSELAIEVPGGIDDEQSRLLVDIINERLDALPIENVLVWYLAAQTSEQLVLLAEMLGLTAPEFGGAAPTAELLKDGVRLQAIRGTPGALEEVTTRLGYDHDETDEEAFKKCDGEIKANGEWRAGADRNYRFWQIYFAVDAPMTTAEKRALWDLVFRWKRKASAFAIGLRQTGQLTLMIRTRP